MAACASKDKGAVFVDGVQDKPVGHDVQLTVRGKVAGELVVTVLLKPVGAAFSYSLDRSLKRFHVVMLTLEALNVAQESGPVSDLALRHG
ncbi:Uncharacterised protein [Actinomyces bovis]|uniref:Uncharacterized protein n=1 Tax=Actinomyces bovis TaxID=1658 RepID=A0ABY1VKW2_9ACTO|nr:Uncharacterised protein [Actinomyces bovis]VEG54731.1 Uncharacterised protein [Actinomyces israelii]